MGIVSSVFESSVAADKFSSSTANSRTVSLNWAGLCCAHIRGVSIPGNFSLPPRIICRPNGESSPKSLQSAAAKRWHVQCSNPHTMNISLYQAASALNANARWQEVIADNLASSSTPGFRKQELNVEAVRAGLLPAPGQAVPGATAHFALPSASTSTNFVPGELRYTGVNTDLAIEGSGFFEVQLPNGSSAFTRDGEFRFNGQGQLTTKQGFPVLGDSGPVQIDSNNPAPVTISASGEISQGTDQLGSIRPVDFDQPQLLKPISGGLFLANDPNLMRAVPTQTTLRQGWIEGSNTSVSTEMANLMTSMRAFEANQRVIQIQDQRMAKTIEQLGNP